MKHIPKNTESEEINYKKGSHLKEVALLTTGIFASFIIFLVFITVFVNTAIELTPMSVDTKIHNLFHTNFTKVDKNKKYYHILQKLIENSDLKERNFSLSIIKSEQENAFAAIGGHISITEELIIKARSENEVAMVLAHELGHYKLKHISKKLGQNFIQIALSVTLSGSNSSITQGLLNSLSITGLAFSRDQERDADSYALDLLNKTYGHVGGATEFFKRIAKKDNLPEFISTHPLGENRVKDLEKMILEKNYIIKKNIPLEPYKN